MPPVLQAMDLAIGCTSDRGSPLLRAFPWPAVGWFSRRLPVSHKNGRDTLLNRLTRLYFTVQALGWENLPRRVAQFAKQRLRILERRLPGGAVPDAILRQQFQSAYDPRAAQQHWLRRGRLLGLDPAGRPALQSALRGLIPQSTWDETVGQEVRDLRDGWMRFFSRHRVQVGNPPAFHRDPIHGVEWPTGLHFTRYDQFNPDRADLKCVWEASRFSWAFALARHSVYASDDSAADLFWEFLDAWDRQNPYGLTAAWACGQESSFRMFAWVFAACATLGRHSATTSRLARLTELVWYTARHVTENIVYARGQKNNHALSEGAALYTVGLLFPELNRADEWAALGQRVLEEEAARQIYADGSYVQHSVNYHRVMLDDLSWAAWVGRACGRGFSSQFDDRLALAARWLEDITAPSGGEAPNYGANDGARVLPLSVCDYADFRPTVQLSSRLAGGRRPLPRGPWDEACLWLDSSARDPAGRGISISDDRCAQGPGAPRSTAKAAGGYYLMRGPRSRAMIRCHAYRDRPSQADMLHLDLHYAGQDVLRDGGSYFYYTQEPWQSWFYSTAAHNTVEVDDQNQMLKGPRFLWLRWVKGRCLSWQCAPDGRADYFRGVHTGYARIIGRVLHDRTLLRDGDVFYVLDEIRGEGLHRATLRWRLGPQDWQAFADEWRTSIAGATYAVGVRGSHGSACRLKSGQTTPRVEGWHSRYYAEKQPAPTLVWTAEGRLPIRWLTRLGPVQRDEEDFDLAFSDPQAWLRLRRAGPSLRSLITRIADPRIQS